MSRATLTIELGADLAGRLAAEAKARGWTSESLAADCVAQHLELSIRHLVLIERLEEMDQHVIELAEFVAGGAPNAGDVDVGRICRYRPESAAADK